MECLQQVHWCAAKRVLRYLAGATNHEMMIGNVRGDEQGQEKVLSGLYGYSDSD